MIESIFAFSDPPSAEIGGDHMQHGVKFVHQALSETSIPVPAVGFNQPLRGDRMGDGAGYHVLSEPHPKNKCLVSRIGLRNVLSSSYPLCHKLSPLDVFLIDRVSADLQYPTDILRRPIFIMEPAFEGTQSLLCLFRVSYKKVPPDPDDGYWYMAPCCELQEAGSGVHPQRARYRWQEVQHGTIMLTQCSRDVHCAIHRQVQLPYQIR